MKKRILVLGGTGNLGKPVAEALMKSGFAVRLMVRDLAKAADHFPESCELVEGEVSNLKNLNDAMRECYGVHISIGGPVDQLSAQNVAYLAPAMDIQRISYISGATVCEENRWFPMVEQKWQAEKAIRESGIDYTLFCPTWAMEMLPRFVRNGQAAMIGKHPMPLHFFAAADLGRMVANAYQNEAAINQRFYVHGPEAIKMKQALERYCAGMHPEVKKVSVLPVWMAKLIGVLSGNKGLRFAAKLMGYFDKVGEMGDPTEANAILGAPKITLEEWIEKQRTGEAEVVGV